MHTCRRLLIELIYFYAFETGGHVVTHILHLYNVRRFTDQSVYLYKSDCSWDYNPVWISPKRYLNLSVRVGKKRDVTVRPVKTYIYLCGHFVQPCYHIYSNLPSVTARLELNVRQAWKNLCTIGILSNKDSWCLVPVSSNTYTLRLSVRSSDLAKIRTTVPCISQRYCVVIFHRSTQQENCATKHAVMRRSCDCNAWQSEWGFVPGKVDLLLQGNASNCQTYLVKGTKSLLSHSRTRG